MHGLAPQALARPSDEDVDKTIRATQEALEKVVQNKLSSVNPANVPTQPGGSTLIKYTPAQQGPQVRVCVWGGGRGRGSPTGRGLGLGVGKGGGQ